MLNGYKNYLVKKKKELKKIEPKMLNADKVIEWINRNICTFYDYDGNEMTIETLERQFKKDFGL